MFNIILMLPLLLLSWCTDIMAEDEFYLNIDLLNREVSKDSNSQRYFVEVKGKKVRYEYSYSGFPDNSQKSSTRTLTDDQLSKIIKYIKESGINKSTTENKPNDANGPSIKVHLSLLLTMEGQPIESKISGNYRINRADGKIKGTIIKNKEYIDAVESLVGYFK